MPEWSHHRLRSVKVREPHTAFPRQTDIESGMTRATMTELVRLREAPCPRDAKLCKLVAQRISPAWGFVAYGVLYFFFVPMLAFVGGLMGGMVALSSIVGKPLPPWAAVFCIVLGVVGFVLGWWPFAVWVRRRRREGFRLGEQGVLTEGTVVVSFRGHVRGAPFTRATLAVEHDGKGYSVITSIGGHPTEFDKGRMVPVLLLPGSKYAAAFALSGRTTGARVG